MKVGTLLRTGIPTYLTFKETPGRNESVFLPKGELLLYLGGHKNIHGDWYEVMTRSGVIGHLSSFAVKEVK